MSRPRRSTRYLAGASAIAVSLALSGCGEPAARAPASAGQCVYDARLLDTERFELEVEVSCSGPRVTAFRAHHAAGAELTRAWQSKAPLARSGEDFELAEPSNSVRMRYRVQLGEMAARYQDFDIALVQPGSAAALPGAPPTGAALVAPAYSWLLSPEPLPAGLPIHVRVSTPRGLRFATGLRPAPDARAAPPAASPVAAGLSEHVLSAQELRVATYSAFGDFEVERLEFPAPFACSSARNQACAPGVLEVVSLPLLGQAHRSKTQIQAVKQWVARSAGAVSDFWGGFPVERAVLILIPVRNRDRVVFGKVLPASAPAVAILLGEDASESELSRDWVLVHELFHLGVPSFSGEGKWFDEGLATYYEPLIRARVGNKTELEVWSEFAENLDQGLAAMRSTGLESTRDFSAVYWGGALVSLLADVKVRRESGGARGLEDGLREVLRQGGHASEVWELRRVIEVVDRKLGTPVLKQLYERYGARGGEIDLDRLFSELGVQRSAQGTALRGGGAAELRQKLLYPGGPSEPPPQRAGATPAGGGWFGAPRLSLGSPAQAKY